MRVRALVVFGLLLYSSLSAENQKDSDMASISEAFGHVLAKNLKHLDVKFDVPRLVKGIQDGCAGKEAPMSERECIEAIQIAQEGSFKELSRNNLERAQLFLDSHANDEGIIALEGGKLQYCVLVKGNGAAIKPSYAPLIRYSVKTLDGTLIGADYQEESISLDETISGLRAGLLGMQEGEKRVLYIHPDLSYREKGCLIFPPNVLLIFEIELLKANTH